MGMGSVGRRLMVRSSGCLFILWGMGQGGGFGVFACWGGRWGGWMGREGDEGERMTEWEDVGKGTRGHSRSVASLRARGSVALRRGG
jgi:hypothetical protein